ncbi:hypothetical protein [Desulforamulus reducens]|nr:hypothetical protein [Desulforamulus reducens]
MDWVKPLTAASMGEQRSTQGQRLGDAAAGSLCADPKVLPAEAGTKA